MIEIIAIDTPSLGDRGYLVTGGAGAVVIDAQRDFDRILAAAAERDVVITHVFETHIHNDYVTGGLALARAAGAEYLVNADDPVRFERTPVRDGDIIDAGGLAIAVLATPGHTFTHLSYALLDGAAVPAVFTGGSLLNGATGRPDLLGAEHTPALAAAQFASARRLARDLPGAAQVCPTHGFGSFCSAGPAAGAAATTLAQEKLANPALTLDEAGYVSALLAGLDDYPAYYAHMGPVNLAGPAAPDLAPPRRASPAELRRRIEAGEWVVDLRSRTAFARGHLPGTLNFGLGQNLATYLGWLIPWGTPLTLLGETEADVAQAQRELARIGIDRPAAANSGSLARWLDGTAPGSFAVADFAALAGLAGRQGLVLLDVRRRSEWAAGRLPGALHIPLHELAGRLGEIPPGQVWVHCQGGYRAAIAASMLAARGRDVVAIDADFSTAAAAGLATAGNAV